MQSPDEFKQSLHKLFLERFGAPCDLVAAAPGRVNLIGEHTDYNDGFVLPMALDREVYVAARKRADGKLRLFSVDYNQGVELELSGLKHRSEGSWDNYVAAVYWVLGREGYQLSGADLLILGKLPQGTGLSSSAALELAVARAACGLSGWAWDPVAMALAGQKAENQFIGVNCGIMDQFAVAVCQPFSALFLDCRSLEHRSIPIPFKSAEFIVVNSCVKRELKTSAYNERRAQCAEAVSRLQALKPGIKALRDASLADLAATGGKDELWFRRARHVISEDLRTQEAVKALEKAEAPAFGRLMSASHASLRDDYEVSCRELDVLVEEALKVPGVHGSRLTGAGFGGCTVSLVEASAGEAFQRQVSAAYKSRTGIEAQVFKFRPGQSARIL